jgi:hypothetical protein
VSQRVQVGDEIRIEIAEADDADRKAVEEHRPVVKSGTDDG